MKTFHGSCHCGAIKFEVDLDLEAETRKCNCSYCQKARSWFVLVPPGLFRLDGNPNISVHQFGNHTLQHKFCPTCGVHAFGTSNPDVIPDEKAWVYVNVTTLDDMSDGQRGKLSVKAVDGRNDKFENEISAEGL